MANFFIQVDKPFYFAGDMVSGNILVNVTAYLAATGISLKFSGYQCVKWNQSNEIVRPTPVQGRPPPPDPIARIPPHLIMNTDNFDISEVTSEDKVDLHDRRPQYIRTSANRVYQMRYFENKNVFTRVKTMVYQCNGLAPGQYSFPFSFKTFEGWPASFEYRTSRKKGKITYHMTAAVEPVNPMWQMQHATEIIIRESKLVSTATKNSVAEVKSCCCISKGSSAMNVHFQKDGYMPGEQVRLIIEVDNTQCDANIETIFMTVSNTIGLRTNQGSTSDNRQVLSRVIRGVPAGTKMVGNEAIKEGFILQGNGGEIKPSCNGKLLSSVYDLSIGFNHDVACQCCSDQPRVGLRLMIFPNPFTVQMPSTFQKSWAPQMMPMANLTLGNTFDDFNIANMVVKQSEYPPLPALGLAGAAAQGPIGPPPGGININMSPMGGGANMNASIGTPGMNANVNNGGFNANMNGMNMNASTGGNMNMNMGGMGGMNASVGPGGANMRGPNMNMNMSGGPGNMNASIGQGNMNANLGPGGANFNANNGGFNANTGGGMNANINMGQGGPNFNANAGGFNANMGGMNANANTGGFNANMGGGMNANVNSGGFNANMGGMSMNANMGGMNANANMGGMNMNANMGGMGGPNMNMRAGLGNPNARTDMRVGGNFGEETFNTQGALNDSLMNGAQNPFGNNI